MSGDDGGEYLYDEDDAGDGDGDGDDDAEDDDVACRLRPVLHVNTVGIQQQHPGALDIRRHRSIFSD